MFKKCDQFRAILFNFDVFIILYINNNTALFKPCKILYHRTCKTENAVCDVSYKMQCPVLRDARSVGAQTRLNRKLPHAASSAADLA